MGRRFETDSGNTCSEEHLADSIAQMTTNEGGDLILISDFDCTLTKWHVRNLKEMGEPSSKRRKPVVAEHSEMAHELENVLQQPLTTGDKVRLGAKGQPTYGDMVRFGAKRQPTYGDMVRLGAKRQPTYGDRVQLGARRLLV